MPNTIGQIRLINSFHNSICPWREKKPEELTREDKEHPLPPRRKGFEFSYTAEDLFEDSNEEDRKLFHKEWVRDITTGKKSKSEFIDYLLKRGFHEEQAEYIIFQAIENAKRQISWADFNKSKGKAASDLMTSTIALGVLSKVLDHESVPKTIRTCVNVAHGVSLGARTYNQGSIYNRPDDDAAKNRFEAEYYGATVTGTLADAAMNVETKVRFWAEPLAELLPEPFRGIAKIILPVFSTSWWRARMASAINHEFLTDLLRFLVHKPLSLFGFKNSIEILEGIEKRKNLKWSYIKERHYKNAGITDKNDKNIFKLISQMFNLLKNCFSKNVEIKKDSSTKLGNTLAPTFGMYGLLAVTAGAIGKVVLKILGKDESRLVDFLASSGVLSQQNLYLFRIVFPLQSEVIDLNAKFNNPDFIKDFSKKQLSELQSLNKKKSKLMQIGFGTFLLNALNAFLKLKNFENPFLKKGVDILDEIANDLILKFFSFRRHLKGFEFEIYNPELYKTENSESVETENEDKKKEELEFIVKKPKK